METEQQPPGDDAVILGRVSGLFGVRGWVKVFSYTEPRENLLVFDTCWLRRDGEWQGPLRLRGKRHGKSVIAQIGDIDDRDTAATLMGADIGVPAEDLPDPGDGRYYFRDLEGCEVRHRDGRKLGRVAYVMETGANDVLVVHDDDFGQRRERLIPFVVGDVILDVDVQSQRIEVDWQWD